MIDLFIAAAEQEEPSKTLYFVAGGALTIFAIAISAFGLSRPDFPVTALQARAVMAASVVLVLFTIAAVLITS